VFVVARRFTNSWSDCIRAEKRDGSVEYSENKTTLSTSHRQAICLSLPALSLVAINLLCRFSRMASTRCVHIIE